jgi:hypothetical protein
MQLAPPDQVGGAVKRSTAVRRPGIIAYSLFLQWTADVAIALPLHLQWAPSRSHCIRIAFAMDRRPEPS